MNLRSGLALFRHPGTVWEKRYVSERAKRTAILMPRERIPLRGAGAFRIFIDDEGNSWAQTARPRESDMAVWNFFENHPELAESR
jgi:hypothetical protein